MNINIQNLYKDAEILESELWWKYPTKRRRSIKEDLEKTLSDIADFETQEFDNIKSRLYKENMYKKIAVKNDSAGYIKELFYFVDWCLKVSESYIDIEENMISESLYWSLDETAAVDLINLFDNFVFKYDYFTFEQDYTKGYFRSSFLYIKDQVIMYLRNKFNIKDNKVYPHFDSHLPASPSKEAYKKVANSNLKITDTGKTYASIFK